MYEMFSPGRHQTKPEHEGVSSPENSENNNDIGDLRKVILLGTEGVGKTSLFRLFVGEESSTLDHTTLQDAIHMKTVQSNTGKQVQIWLWDTAGMERMRDTLTNSYYRDTSAALFVFDPCNTQTLEALNSIWIESVTSREGDKKEDKSKKFLVMNKMDKVRQMEENQESEFVTIEKMQNFVSEQKNRKCHFDGVYTISTKTNEGVEEMFQDIASKVIQQDNPLKSQTHNNSLKLSNPTPTQKEGIRHRAKHWFRSKCTIL